VKRIPSLDGLRAISISLVIAGHWCENHYGVTGLVPYGNLGVRIFFVISGYLITKLLLQEHAKTSDISLTEFYRRRAYRILPPAALYMLVIMVIWWPELRWYDVGAASLYLANFDFRRPWFIGHLWSLGVEEQFYLLWPGVLKRWYKHRVRVLLAVIFLAPIYSSVCYFLKVPAGGYGTFPAVADNLAMGCLLAIVSSRIPRISGSMAIVMLFVTLLVPWYSANTRSRSLIMLFVLWPVLHASIAGLILHVVRIPYRFLNWKPIVWIGQISYSLYLWQQPFCFGPHAKPWYFPLLALGIAMLSYYMVERPMLRLRDRRKREILPAYVCAAGAGD
jgi:peptidoglycan/LPS O-acetylase OafA/YrhL